MNVFEDLIVELKEENLLENTVIDVEHLSPGDDSYLHETVVNNQAAEMAGPVEFTLSEVPADESGGDETYRKVIEEAEQKIDDLEVTHVPEAAEVSDRKSRKEEKEFFQKRAASEIASLQVVEHILTGVERERMKILPKSFDDLNAKKALHAYIQLADDGTDEKRSEIEFSLMKETEGWCSALAARDRSITVSNVRLYCENSKPKLSSQALLALGRFYRNLPYTESVRGKFDFVVTRLFSRPQAGERRQLLFSHDEMLGHIKTLYADWSSVPLYAADDDDSNILLTALSFQELASEAENSASFDDLIKSDFFGRLRLFKESISELFFAPVVTAAAIDCNVRFGNAYIDLIEQARQQTDAGRIRQQVGDINEQVLSDMAARTIDLGLLLNEPVIEFEPVEEVHEEPVYEAERVRDPLPASLPNPAPAKETIGHTILANVKQTNKALAISLAVFLLLSAGILVWAEFIVPEKVSSVGVRAIEFENSNLKDQIKTAKVSGDTLYVVMEAGWETLSKEKRQDFIQKLYQMGNDKGYENVTAFDSKGKMSAYASKTRFEITSP